MSDTKSAADHTLQMDAALRGRLSRLAHMRPELRPHLLPLLRTACGPEAPMVGKFEEGKPADPTENMSPEDKKRWWSEHEKNKDNFAKSALVSDPLAWPRALESYILDNPLPLGDRWDIVKMSGDEFKVECVESVAFLHGKTYYAGEPDAVVSIMGKDSLGRSFKRQLPVGDKLVPNLIRLLSKIKRGCGRSAGAEAPVVGKFEEGKPADPTENMTEEQKKRWWSEHEKNKDNFTKAAGERGLSNALIRLAAANDTLRPLLLPMLKEACGCGGGMEAPMVGKFEEGKPADPTENMSPEDKKRWWSEHEKNKDNFAKSAARASLTGPLLQPVHTKSGARIPEGTTVTVSWVTGHPSLALLTADAFPPVKTSVWDLSKYLDGFMRPPSKATLQKWAAEGVSLTPTEAVAQSYGFSPRDGSPAWTLALEGKF